ncbi:MAG: DUF1583 domain-containing protein [Fuerstia sp.]|nr:DUF1583 domain-containing protein [Fuerstiella sp.]
MAPLSPATPSESEALTRAFGDHFLAENVASVRHQANALSPDDRYRFLSDWVLPGERRKTFRLNGHFSPLSPAPPVAEFTAEETQRLAMAEQSGEGRVLVGGSLFSAAFDLVKVAQETGKLNELREHILSTQSLIGSKDAFDHTNRSRLAMLVLTEIAAEQWEAASEHLAELGDIVKGHPIRNPAERWPEMLAFWEGVRHSATGQMANEPLYQFIFQDLHGGPGTGSDVWDRQMLALMGFRKITEAKDLTATDYFRPLPLKQWATAEFDSAMNRGPGMPGSRWMAEDRGISQLAGHENDFVYFQSPLRGDYEIDCQTTTFDWRECAMFFNGRWAGPAWGMTHYESGDHRRTFIRPAMTEKMSTEVGNWFHIRIQSRDGMGRIFANGRQLYEEALTPDHDPWVGARFWHRYHGGIRDVRITGTPQIPDSLNLLHDRQLTGWAAYYELLNFSALLSWQFDGDQLLGRSIKDPVDANYESLLRYHRPMLENGSIEYDFFYEPGRQHVHPALDRLSFLLDPDAVRIHWCTDGAFDRTGLSPQNVSDEPNNQTAKGPLPFVANDWNRLKLQLTGNQVELLLNNQSVFRRTLEASNMRRFGLFHFPGQTSARVRRVVWTGDWPKQLPAPEDQELADVEFITKLDQEALAMEIARVDFSDRQPVPAGFRQNLDGTGGAISEYQPSPTGLQAIQEGKKADTWRVQALVAPHSLVGDFDVVAEFEQLKMDAPTNADKEKFPGINLTAKLESTPFARVYFHARRNSSGNVFLDTMSEHQLEDGGSRWNVQGFSQETSAGKLRLARRGTNVYYLFANGDSEQFRIYRIQAVPDAPVKANSLELQTLTGGIGRTSVVWKSLTIRAKGLSDIQ